MSAAAGSAPSALAGRRRLPLGARGSMLFGVVVVATLAASVPALVVVRPDVSDWERFVLIAGAAAIAQLFTVRTGRSHGFHTAVAFVAAAALLLPAGLIPLLAIVQHVPEWLKERYPWHIQTFNVCNFILDGLAAWAAAWAVLQIDGLAQAPRFALAAAAAGVALVLVNHLLLASMLKFERRISFAESGLFGGKDIAIDLVLVGVGAVIALTWRTNPWLTPAVLGPLVLTHLSFSMLALARESEERFRAMFRSAPYGTALLDLEGNVIDANNALERMLGYSAAELAMLPLDAYSDSDDASQDRALFKELVEDRRPPYETDHRYIAKDGSIVWAHTAVSLIRDPGQRPTFGIAVLEDVTGRRELEEQLRQSQKMEAVGRLAGGIAHDFNNLLTAIGGYAELALRRTSSGSKEIQSDLGEIKRAADRAAGLTRQLLAFSRKQILQPKVLKLSDLVGEMDTMLNRLIGETVEIVTITYGPGGSFVMADPGQLEQVVVNLVVNARDAMPDGGRITIETATVDLDIDEARAKESVEAGPYVVLTVRDTGEGIDQATMQRLFEPFFTTKEAGKGTGLGLATVYGIVKQSGGFLEVDSEPGEGATFRIYLPRHDGEPLVVAPPSFPEPAATTQPSETILLVEDEDVVRRLALEILEQTGYKVLEAPDALEALAIARSHPEHIDLLVTDVVMPKMNGRELAERLTKLVGDVRVLYTSGYTDSEIVQDGMLQPGTAFLQKPFTVAQLAEKVKELLESRR